MSMVSAFRPKTLKRFIGRIRIAILAIASLLLMANPGHAAQGIYSEEVVVGTHVDLSGPLSAWGIAVRNGIEMAFEEANEAGGVNDRRLGRLTLRQSFTERIDHACLISRTIDVNAG